MTRPTEIIDPVTGFICYTKHPDKLIERKRAKKELERLVITDQRLGLAEQNPTFWNGSEAPWKMHKPGEVRS